MKFHKNKLFYKYIIFLFLLLCIFLNLFIYYLDTFNNYEIEIFNLQTQEFEILNFCSSYKDLGSDNSISTNAKLTYTYSYKFIDAFPEISNLKCLRKIVEVWESTNPGEFHFLYGSNLKIFESINIAVNSLLILLLTAINFNLKNSRYSLFCGFLLIYFNFVLNSIFQIDNTILGFLNDISSIILILSVGFLFFQIIHKNNKVLIGSFYYYLLFDYEFLGIFVVITYLVTKFKYDFSSKERLTVYLIPFTFYTARFIAGSLEALNTLWLGMFQSTYRGLSRFMDLQADFTVLKCHTDMTFAHTIKFMDVPITNYCEETIGYGPIRKLIPLYGDVWSSVLIAIVILFLFILLQYKDLIYRYSDEFLFVTLLFISPPINLLVHLSNPDIFYLAFLYFVLKKYKSNPLFASFVIYVFTLWKIHAIGILFGLLIFSLIEGSRKNIQINISFLLFTVFTYIIDIRTTEPLSIPSSPDERMGFGVLHDAIQLTKFIEFNNQKYVLLFVVLLILIILSLVFFMWKNMSDNLLSKYKSYEIYGVVFWYFLSMIFQNQSYRLPLFILLFVHIFKFSNKVIKTSLVMAIFLNPVFISNYILFEKITLVLNRIGIYLVFSYLLTIFLYDFWHNIVLKFFTRRKDRVLI